jgi:hypothetical protein
MASGLNITELTATPEIAHAYQLMALLRPHVVEDRFVDQVRAEQQDGYRLIGGASSPSQAIASPVPSPEAHTCS